MSNQGEKCWYFAICSPVPFFFMDTFDVIYRVPTVTENSIFSPSLEKTWQFL